MVNSVVLQDSGLRFRVHSLFTKGIGKMIFENGTHCRRSGVLQCELLRAGLHASKSENPADRSGRRGV